MKNDLIAGFIMMLLIVVLILNGFLIFSTENINKNLHQLEQRALYQDVSTNVTSQTKSDDENISVEIWIDEDHTIHRTGLDDTSASLGWEIIYNGETVLSRNARNETEYKYFRSDPGTYTVYVSSYIDGRYRAISNIESYYID